MKSIKQIVVITILLHLLVAACNCQDTSYVKNDTLYHESVINVQRRYGKDGIKIKKSIYKWTHTPEKTTKGVLYVMRPKGIIIHRSK